MIKLAANLSFLFTDLPFTERIAAAAECGFRGVECLFPYSHPAEEIARKCREVGVTMALFNALPGNWERGDRGIAALPGRDAEFRETLEVALEYAATLECPLLHVMAGVCDASERDQALVCYCDNLGYAADRAAAAGLAITIEPLNHFDVPGYVLRTVQEACDVLRIVGHPSIGLQFDFYHQQIIGGDLTRSFQAAVSRVRHVQIAGVPDRGEPDSGEVDVLYVMKMIDDLGYKGWVGCEYRPRGDTREGLGWAKRYLLG